jgi:hypothetical protein
MLAWPCAATSPRSPQHDATFEIVLDGVFVPRAAVLGDDLVVRVRDRAVFSIFRRTAETPLYRIEKLPQLRRKQGQYTLFGPEGQVLKRGGDLRPVLSPLERKLLRALD